MRQMVEAVKSASDGPACLRQPLDLSDILSLIGTKRYFVLHMPIAVWGM